MKIAMLIMTMLFTTQLFAGVSEVSLKSRPEIRTTEPVNPLVKDKRMIAGKFETSSQKNETYLDGLRSKLKGMKSIGRY